MFTLFPLFTFCFVTLLMLFMKPAFYQLFCLQLLYRDIDYFIRSSNILANIKALASYFISQDVFFYVFRSITNCQLEFSFPIKPGFSATLQKFQIPFWCTRKRNGRYCRVSFQVTFAIVQEEIFLAFAVQLQHQFYGSVVGKENLDEVN